MIVFIISCIVIGFMLAPFFAARQYKKLSKRNGEITLVKVKSISGKRFTFEIHYGSKVKYEAWAIGTPRYNDLMGFVKE